MLCKKHRLLFFLSFFVALLFFCVSTVWSGLEPETHQRRAEVWNPCESTNCSLSVWTLAGPWQVAVQSGESWAGAFTFFKSKKSGWWPMVAPKKSPLWSVQSRKSSLSYPIFLFSILFSYGFALEHEARRALTNFSERCGSVAQGRRCCGHGAAVGPAILWFLKS